MVTSTPNVSREGKMDMRSYSDVSIIERSLSPPLLISDSSVADLEEISKVTKRTEMGCDCDPHSIENKWNKTKEVNKSLADDIMEFNSGFVFELNILTSKKLN
ncbi:unnamed protein product [Euphydryas editha]|uniref:Uncharacterized protein n=1 Tax=Euphydryas editha TaxID=104508 RepID=A0AAU9UZR0_EUPED|nr:unnamed protein product [Euphydryas editha]